MDTGHLFENCIFDVCAYDGDRKVLEDVCITTLFSGNGNSDHQTYINSIKALDSFAGECQENKVRVCNWRKDTNFATTCPPNSQYDGCASACPNTCTEPFAADSWVLCGFVIVVMVLCDLLNPDVHCRLLKIVFVIRVLWKMETTVLRSRSAVVLLTAEDMYRKVWVWKYACLFSNRDMEEIIRYRIFRDESWLHQIMHLLRAESVRLHRQPMWQKRTVCDEWTGRTSLCKSNTKYDLIVAVDFMGMLMQ